MFRREEMEEENWNLRGDQIKLLSVTFQEDFLQPAEQVGNSEGQHLTWITVLKFSSGVKKTC